MRLTNKICLGCQRQFEARADAKTCSARCRKRFQRARRIVQARQVPKLARA